VSSSSPTRAEHSPPARPYQSEGSAWLRRVGRGLLADDMGLGKSRTMLDAADGDTLVLAPAMVLQGGTWTDEHTRWRPELGLHQVAYSSTTTRTKVVKATDTTPRSGASPTGKVRPDLNRPWGTLILDEAHNIKGRDTYWTKTAKALAARSEQVFLASGSPIPNWAHELFVPLQVLYPAKAGRGGEFGSFWRWAERWFDTSPTRWSQGLPAVGDLLECTKACEQFPPHAPCQHYRDFAEANLGDRFLQRLRDDVLGDLPPLTQLRVETPMTQAQAKVYKALKRDYVAWVQGGGEIVAWTDAALNVKLQKVCTGVDLLDAGVKASGKFERLRLDLAGRTRPTLVFAHFRDTLELAQARVARPLKLKSAVVHGGTSGPARLKAVRAFQAGELDVLFGSLETLAEGVTLIAADVLIFLEKSYKPSRNEQALRRFHRLGQDRPCLVLDYVAPGTVDERVRELLLLKTDRQMRHLAAARFAALL
jgi:SWI/SNF-related matrix-associated actin-dependent regulator 1 of chromatin subfamily A